MPVPTRTQTSDSGLLLQHSPRRGYVVVDEFYDAAVSGADPIAERLGFKAMLDRIAGNGVRVIPVESPDRFARDLTVQLTGHDFLKSRARPC
jgi:DNA invertase Pin-like site-specific DNA recombinase